MSMDFNNADKQKFDLIPMNTLARVNMTIRPGSHGPEGWLTKSKTSDAEYLDIEFVVMSGPFAKKRFWQNMVLSGGKLDGNGNSVAGNITRSTLRAILESARNIQPEDTSDKAMAARKVASYGDFNVLEFAVKIGVEKDSTGQWGDKNKIQVVITPDKKEYAEIMNGSAPSCPLPQPPQAPAPQSTVPQWAQ